VRIDLLQKLGRRAFVQSIRPYKGGTQDGVAIFGLDTEYVPYLDLPSDLLSWQLASDNQSLFTTQPLTIKNLYQESKKMLGGLRAKVYVYVTFFSLAEIQFMDLNDWVISEFKGKYKLTANYGDGRLMIVDLADWYQHEKLSRVATYWNEKKVTYPIAKKVTDIAKGKYTKEQLLAEPEFREYALHDAVITQRIYKKMREYFLEMGVDIIKTMTPANTSASIFRATLEAPIQQHDTKLRSMALKCCWGGRMECLWRGHLPKVYEYDATAHHPSSAIALGVLPRENDWKHTVKLSQWLSAKGGVGKIYFRFLDEERYPCLPVYDKDALIFPLEGISFCTVHEARLAREIGAKLLLHDGYCYNDGIPFLTHHLMKLQAIRNKSKDKAERKLLKLLSNSIIGKFFQKKIGIDLDKVQKYAQENDLPFEEAINMKGVDFGEGTATVGSCFYPEWYALILGYARASISKTARDHQALIISSDSFVVDHELSKKFTDQDITYTLKTKGELVAYRTRFYRVGTKLAHHAVHNKKAAGMVLKTFIPEGVFEYSYHRFLHLRESWKHKKVFGSRTFRLMTVKLGFDTKRRLLEGMDGWSRPWKDIKEREEYGNGKTDPLLEDNTGGQETPEHNDSGVH